MPDRVSVDPAGLDEQRATLMRLIAPVMGAWTIDSPYLDRAPREVADAVIAAGWRPVSRNGAGRSHPKCWVGDHYRHICHEPSGRHCIDCGKPAGTPWGPYWCPDCDVRRLDRVGAGFAAVEAAFEERR